MSTKYPKGLYYDSRRNRWRARLLIHGSVVSVSYHKNMTDAQNALDKAKECHKKDTIRNPITTMDMLMKMRAKYYA